MIPPSTRLRRAIHHNDVVLVSRLIRIHPTLLRNPDYADKSNTSLHLAAALGHVDIARALLALGHDETETSRNTEHETPLMLAARAGHVAVATELVRSRPRSVPLTNAEGLDVLCIAAQSPASTSLIPALLAAPAHASSVHVRDHLGNTPLHHASASGSLKALRLLLAAGADPFAANNADWMPLAYSQTVAAEVYFKNLVAESERRRVEAQKGSEERARQRKAGVRIVEQESEAAEGEDGDDVGGMREEGEEVAIGDALKRHWGPVERRSGGLGIWHEWGAAGSHLRTRSGSGD